MDIPKSVASYLYIEELFVLKTTLFHKETSIENLQDFDTYEKKN